MLGSRKLLGLLGNEFQTNGPDPKKDTLAKHTQPVAWYKKQLKTGRSQILL